MRTRAKFISEAVGLSLKNIKRLEVQFDPFHPNAANLREFYQGATSKYRLRSNPECVVKAKIVCDQSDPLVTVHFQNNHKLVLNSKYLESGHIARLIKQFSEVHKHVADEDV